MVTIIELSIYSLIALLEVLTFSSRKSFASL
jgi:hypothetical protein